MNHIDPGNPSDAAHPGEPDPNTSPGRLHRGSDGAPGEQPSRRGPPTRALIASSTYPTSRAAERRRHDDHSSDMRARLNELPVPPASTAEAAPFAWLPFLIGFIRRRWPWMVASTVGCTALALLYALSSTPQFTASTQLLIDIRRADLLSQQHELQDAQTLNSELESRVEILRSEGLARQVVEHFDLQHAFAAKPTGVSIGGWVRTMLNPAKVTPSADTLVDQATLRLMQMTSVRRIGLTYVIEIGVTSPSAIQSAQLANALVTTYITGQLTAQDQVTRQAGQWLQQRLQELRDQALSAGSAVEKYKAEKNIIGTDKGLLNEQQLTELNSQLGAARQHSAAARIRAEQSAQLLHGDVMSAGLNSDLQSTVINTLRTEYLDDQQRAARWSATYGAGNMQVVKLRGEMAQIELAIRSELHRIAAAAQNEYNVAHADEVIIQSRLNAMVDLTVKTNSDRVKLSSLQSSADTYRSVYENFLNRFTQAVQDESFPVSEARVITEAKPPLRKSAPHTSVLLALGMLLGLASGFVVALARELLDRRLRTDAQLRSATGLACIGHLPMLGERRGGAVKLPGGTPASTELRVMPAGPAIIRSVIDNPHSEFVQALRSLRVRLMRASGSHREIRLIGFAPAKRGDGSTTVAANFAQVLVASGYRTVLVDLDSEDDTLSRAMTPDGARGLLDALAEDDLADGLMWHDDKTGVDVLPLGGRSARAPLRFTPDAAERLFDALLSTHDYVVVDLPPLTPAVESQVLGHLLDAVILVVDWGDAQHDKLSESLRETGLDLSKLVGALYNKVDFKEMRAYAASMP